MAKNFIGLYYPYIHFRDESWLKASALYWDKINRIVPDDMIGRTDDSWTVKLFKDELGFIDDIPPGGYATDLVGGVFARVIKAHEKELQERFHISKKESWPEGATRIRAEYNEAIPHDFDPKLAYIQASKMSKGARDSLRDSGLALFLKRFEFDKDWFGMHPRLASVYMTALAQTMAQDGRMHPLAERDEDHVAVVELSLEEMARVLLSDEGEGFQSEYDQVNKLSQAGLKSRYVQLTFPAVLPKDLAVVEPRKIIELRKGPYTKAFRAFQEQLERMATEKRAEELSKIRNQASRDSHIHDEVQRELLEPLDEMRRRIGEISTDSVSTVMSVLVQLALTVKTGGLAVASESLKMIPSIRAERNKAGEEIASSPAAFLLYLEENLKPANALTRTRRWLRKTTHGV